MEPRYSARQLTSDALNAQFPLTSAVMRGLAQVRFLGATADAAQRSYSPDQVGGFFSADVASDGYNYTTVYEDTAMTLEELLMNRRLGIQRDTAITDKITATTTGNTLIVRWGQRGRIGSAAIKPRARMVAQALVPWFNPNEVDNLPAPLPMRAGQSWNANLALQAPPGAAAREQPLLTREQQAALQRELRRMQHHQHAQGPRLPRSP